MHTQTDIAMNVNRLNKLTAKPNLRTQQQGSR